MGPRESQPRFHSRQRHGLIVNRPEHRSITMSMTLGLLLIAAVFMVCLLLGWMLIGWLSNDDDTST